LKRAKRNSIAIIGGGSWATAITKILSDNGHDIHWWLRNPESVEHIRKFGHNPKYLSSVQFNFPKEQVSTDFKAVISASEWIIFAVPSFYFTDTLHLATKEELEGKKIASAIKGITQHEHYTITQYLNKEYDIPQNLLANISGPCHAEEVASEKLSYLTFSSPDPALATELAGMFANRFMRTSTTTDMVGTEYASVIKNIFAIAAGISIGLGYGDNFRAVLVSEAMEEMNYFLNHISPCKRDILSPPYLGDTLVTAYSQYSRNRTFGLMIGNGYTINSAILELKMVAEGYYASNAIKAICREHNLEMPVADAVYNILYGKISPAIEFSLLTEKLCV
jgi:glycerol-3-phosphate dehydrogenase (NAD(P)+)